MSVPQPDRHVLHVLWSDVLLLFGSTCCCCLVSLHTHPTHTRWHCVLPAHAGVVCRSISSVVYLSNVTLWVPAAEFSFIRSHTAEQPTSFTINLQGGWGPSSSRACSSSSHKSNGTSCAALNSDTRQAAPSTTACMTGQGRRLSLRSVHTYAAQLPKPCQQATLAAVFY